MAVVVRVVVVRVVVVVVDQVSGTNKTKSVVGQVLTRGAQLGRILSSNSQFSFVYPDGPCSSLYVDY